MLDDSDEDLARKGVPGCGPAPVGSQQVFRIVRFSFSPIFRGSVILLVRSTMSCRSARKTVHQNKAHEFWQAFERAFP